MTGKFYVRKHIKLKMILYKVDKTNQYTCITQVLSPDFSEDVQLFNMTHLAVDGDGTESRAAERMTSRVLPLPTHPQNCVNRKLGA
jgi:hypothetical protein